VRTAAPSRVQSTSAKASGRQDQEAVDRRPQQQGQFIGGGHRGQPAARGQLPEAKAARTKIASYDSAPIFLGSRQAAEATGGESSNEAPIVASERSLRPARPLLFSKPKVGL
jgi:hypothetical protein